MMDLHSRWKIFQGLDRSLMSKCKFLKFVHYQKVGFLVLHNGDVYVITDKDSIGYPYEGAAVSQVSKVDSLCGTGIIDFYGNEWGFAALTKDGCVYTWENHQDEDTDRVPRKLGFPGGIGYKVSDVTYGTDHFLCLTSNGEVFGWGNNEHRQLDASPLDADERDAKKITGLNSDIIQVAAGCYTSYALDSAGRVWSWGSFEGASLGYRAYYDNPTPTLVEDLHFTKKISVGHSHVLALTTMGELFFWGSFGRQPTFTPTKRSRELADAEPLIDIASTVDSQYAVFRNKDTVYLCGIWYQQYIPQLIATKLTSIDEAFACAESAIMLQPITMNVQPRRVEDAWKKSFDDPSTSDVIFSIENEKLHAHATFLKLRSEYFRIMFDGDWAESKNRARPIPIKRSFKIFKAFLYFLYNESLIDPDMSVEDLAELMRAADFYGDDDLRLACENKLKSHMTPVNACFVYSCAIQSNAQNLQDYTVEFIGPVFKEVVNSAEFAKMNSEHMTKLMIHFAELNEFQVLKKRRLQ